MKSSSSPATLVIGRDVSPEQAAAYEEWHHRIDLAARRTSGFVASELHLPIEGIQNEWVHVLRFESGDDVEAWLGSPERRVLVAEADARFTGVVHQQVLQGAGSSLPVTVAISHKVRPGCEDAYREWQAGIDCAASQFPGFRGSERHEPGRIETDFIVILRFDSQEHLDDWRGSEERAAWMARRDEFVEESHERRMTGGFDAWFSPAQSVVDGKVPRRWKQALIVLVALYPTSMLYGHFLFPRIPGWPGPAARLLALAATIATLTWVVMPLVTRALARWLDPVEGSRPTIRLAGLAAIVLACAGFVALFTVAFGPR